MPTHASFLECVYCKASTGGAGEHAILTLHDRAGCVHVCARHARWRQAKGRLFGHGDDCPFFGQNQAAAPATDELRALRRLRDALRESFDLALAQRQGKAVDPDRSREVMRGIYVSLQEAESLAPPKPATSRARR
jgi:hypothetical protein